jgi:23S rRNA (pseudouridine1915-N3)-methyltransferase
MIKVIAVGKIKEEFFTKGIEEYQKRLTAFAKVKYIEVKEVNTFEVTKNMFLEGKNILAEVDSTDFVVTLEIEGKKMNSIEFANFIDKLYTTGHSNIDFIIGGSNGLTDEVKKRSNAKLSFSDMTFPHQLMRLIFSEQLYRAFTIINHKEYHK